jgi:TolB-like protein/Tfp pilus assembly protein PilF
VETLPRRGYRFVAPVEFFHQDGGVASVAPIPGAPRDVPPVKTETVARPIRRWPLLTIAPVAALILLALGTNFAGVRQWFLGNSASRQIRFLAVRPLDHLSDDPLLKYLAEGVTDGLTTELAQLSSIPVMSRTSAMAFKNSEKSLKELARELEVDAVVEGSVRRSGEGFEIAVQLIEAGTDSHLWADSYSTTLQELSALQREIARDIVSQLHPLVSPQAGVHPVAAPPLHPEAYEAFLLGRFYASRRTPAGLRESEAHLSQAIAKDPNYAAAYSQLAEVYTLMGASAAAIALPTDMLEKARANAKKALELDPQQSEAHVVLGRVKYILDWDWEGAEKEFEAALQLNPNSALAYHYYALFQHDRGKVNEFCALIERARRLDPLSPNILRAAAVCLGLVRRQYEAALAQARRAAELGPANYNTRVAISWILYDMGRYEESLAEVREADRISKGHPITRACIAIAAVKVGRKAEAAAILRELLRDKGPVPPVYFIARINLALGENEEAIRWLEKAVEMHVPMHLLTDQAFDPLRANPRFQNLLRRMNLAAKEPA